MSQTMTSRVDDLTAGSSVLPLLPFVGKLRRGEFFAGLFVLGCVSGFTSRIIQSVNRLGWMRFSKTFDISVIVWISCIAGVLLVLRDRTIGVRSSELAMGAGFVFLVILPIGPLSWLAVTALSLYISPCPMTPLLDGALSYYWLPPCPCSGADCCFSFLPI